MYDCGTGEGLYSWACLFTVLSSSPPLFPLRLLAPPFKLALLETPFSPRWLFLYRITIIDAVARRGGSQPEEVIGELSKNEGWWGQLGWRRPSRR